MVFFDYACLFDGVLFCIRFFVCKSQTGRVGTCCAETIHTSQKRRVLIFKEGFTIAIKELQINEEIRDKEIRVVSAAGEQLGVMPASRAIEMAYEKNLDLVKIAPTAEPPVCKIMDYGKYKFELAKREKENRRNQKTINIKEVQLSPSIDTNDFNTKCKNAMKFLKNGDKVKVTVRFRGREVSHSEIGEALLLRFAETAKEVGHMERPPKLEGRNMTMFLAPVSQ